MRGPSIALFPAAILLLTLAFPVTAQAQHSAGGGHGSGHGVGGFSGHGVHAGGHVSTPAGGHFGGGHLGSGISRGGFGGFDHRGVQHFDGLDRFHGFDGFHAFHRFDHVRGFDPFHGSHPLHGFHGFGFRHGLHVGIGLGALPFFSFWNGFAYPYYDRPFYKYPDTVGRPPDYGYEGIPRPGDRIAVPGKTGSDSLVIEQVTDSMVRLTWQDRGRQVEEVGLFLADSTPTVLAVQTMRSPPFTALFEPTPDATVAGVSVVWAGGTSSTTLIEYRAASR